MICFVLCLFGLLLRSNDTTFARARQFTERLLFTQQLQLCMTLNKNRFVRFQTLLDAHRTVSSPELFFSRAILFVRSFVRCSFLPAPPPLCGKAFEPERGEMEEKLSSVMHWPRAVGRFWFRDGLDEVSSSWTYLPAILVFSLFSH